MRIGSLCTGYGGLDMAVENFFDAEMVWCAENDIYASKLIQERFNKPNLGDIKQIDWASVEPIDILTAGYPCQPFSHAGNRKGQNDKRHIWPNIIQGISILRPKFIVLENVRGHLSLGFKEVLSDLAQNGYDAKWRIVRASDVGAPHQRARLFIIAYANGEGLQRQIDQKHTTSKCSKFVAHTNSDACEKPRRTDREIRTENRGFQSRQDIGQAGSEHGCSCSMESKTIPFALDQGRLNTKFVEYMMGLPSGWVTDLDLSRSQQLRILGNGVVPQQAYHALKLLFDLPSDLRLC
jgi:DNA (cytosine-5)-methyltransferase 1